MVGENGDAKTRFSLDGETVTRTFKDFFFFTGEAVAGARLERTVPIVFSMSVETFDVGCDTGAPVGPYGHGGVCSAEITGVTLTRLDEPSAEVRRLVAEGLVRAGFSTQ